MIRIRSAPVTTGKLAKLKISYIIRVEVCSTEQSTILKMVVVIVMIMLNLA